VHEVPPGSNTGPDVRTYLAPCVRVDRRGEAWGQRPLDLTSGAWCAAFASYCLWSAHAELDGWDQDQVPALVKGWPLFGNTSLSEDTPRVCYRASVAELVTDAKDTGAWHELGDGAPEPGDLLVMGRNGSDPRHGGEGHVAIVETAMPVGWYTIGGNENNAVRRALRQPGDKVEPVLGFIRT